MKDLIARLEAATEGSRELDWVIAYNLGIGTDKEREVYEKHGAAWCTVDPSIRMTPLNKAQGCHFSYSRPKRGGGRVRTPEQFMSTVTGPQPLRDAKPYTTSLDAALTLVPEGRCWSVWRRSPSCGAEIILEDGSETRGVINETETPALALCIAALKARVA